MNHEADHTNKISCPGRRVYSVAVAGTGFACGCDLPSAGKRVVAEARNKSSAVFSGTVVAIDRKPGDLYVAVRFKLKEFWKGARSEEVIIFTGLGGGDCGYEFEVGQQYLVYAYRHKKNELGTNICQRTNELLDAAQDLKVLGKGKLIGQRDLSKLELHRRRFK